MRCGIRWLCAGVWLRSGWFVAYTHVSSFHEGLGIIGGCRTCHSLFGKVHTAAWTTVCISRPTLDNWVQIFCHLLFSCTIVPALICRQACAPASLYCT